MNKTWTRPFGPLTAVVVLAVLAGMLQFTCLPANQTVRMGLAAGSDGKPREVLVKGTAPPDTTVRMEGGVSPTAPLPAAPQYETLKDLHLDIALVKNGKPAAAIVAPASGEYQKAAAAIQGTIEERTGVKVPIVADDSPEAAVPIRGNRIVLGNRSTNRAMSSLYDLYYCLVDLKYPGPGGYVLRSVHDPFGNGHGLVIVGGSDATGVEAGANVLAGILAKASSGPAGLSIGWTMETKLGEGVQVPTDIRKFEVWKAWQEGGNHGWCSISKRMAMYYMTGDEFSAREVVRLAFPDARAIREIEEIDGERVQKKHDPLGGLYHYAAHMAILHWDLIEESPVFSDEERLKITNAFARQFDHFKSEGHSVYGLTAPAKRVPGNHGQWSAISLYCLGRYFSKYYPDPIWTQCMRGCECAFASLHEYAWSETDNLLWYSKATSPILTYILLTGDRVPQENGTLAELLRNQEILISGRVPDGALNSASMSFLHKAAYLTGDGRWITYRDRLGMDTDVFRLGQSFWPDKPLEPKQPDDLVGKWSIHRLSQPAWEARASGLPLGQSFYFGSYRSSTDASGDYVLLDGYNGASRNPYHNFDVLELRLAGRTVLKDYGNHVLTSADGMWEPTVAMDAALLHCDVVGPTAVAVGEVSRSAFANWRRTLCLRTGRYALVVDDVTFRTDSQNMKIETSWRVPGKVAWDQKEQALRIQDAAAELRPCDVQEIQGGPLVRMAWTGVVKKGSHRLAFYLIGHTAPDAEARLACTRVADNATALALPEPALAVVGQYARAKGDLIVLAEDHLFGRALTSAGIENVIASSDVPVDLDWDFAAGVANVVATMPATLRLSLADKNGLRVDGEPAKVPQANGTCIIELTEGRHVLTGASPGAEARATLAASLGHVVSKGREMRTAALAAGPPRPRTSLAKLSKLPVAMTARVGGKAVDMATIPLPERTLLAVAEGTTIHLLTPDGKKVHKLATDGAIRVLRWWDEPGLLLAGCKDEKVIAFDRDGRRKWVFTSVEDPAVYASGKTYWSKKSPGHEGVHGLYTGVFDDGHSRCFVGSACTLEILDETGTLVKRSPIVVGPCRKFLLVDGPGGTRNLLVSQRPNGFDQIGIVSSKTLTDTGKGYYAVPAGHTYVGGWAQQHRTAMLLDDLEDDGAKEVIMAINGLWNRVTVYSENGEPLANAQFGPGVRTGPRAYMRDIKVADLDGDGTKEIVVAISEGLVVALTRACEKLWSTRLPSAPLSLQCVPGRGAGPSRIVAGCDDGTVVVLDAQGTPTATGKVTGRPTHALTLETQGKPVVFFATDRGEMKGLTIDD